MSKPTIPSDDFSEYLGTPDAREASMLHLETLAQIRVAFGRPMPVETYAAIRAEFTRKGAAR